MVQELSSSPFIQDLAALADTVGPLPDSKAQAFLQQYPLDVIFRELNGRHITSAIIESARTALEKVLNTAYGASLLPQLVPYAAAALQTAAAPSLRQLAVQQLSRLLAAPASHEQQQELIALLLGALRDKDVGVAVAAEGALCTVCEVPGGLSALLATPPTSVQLQELAVSQDPVLSTRALTLALRLAAHSPTSAAAVQQAGLLEPLLATLHDPSDTLACTAALQLVREAAEACDAGMALALSEVVLPLLGALVAGGQDTVLRCASMQVGAALLAAALKAGNEPMAVDGPASSTAGTAAAAAAASPHPLLGMIKTALDVSSAEDVPLELEEAAMDAVGTVGLEAPGAAAILLDPTHLFSDVTHKALGRAPSPAIRIGALHALAAVAGAERATEAGRSAAALLGPRAEDALRTAVFEGALASSPTATPAGVLFDYLSQPFLELRVASYRALGALLARDWMAAAVAAHPELLDFLLNPQSEHGRQGCEWRHACVLCLAATVRCAALGAGTANGLGAGVEGSPYASVLAGIAQRVDDAAAAGPYGANRQAPADFQVATVHRGGGGL